jgi:hypothetical protein
VRRGREEGGGSYRDRRGTDEGGRGRRGGTEENGRRRMIIETSASLIEGFLSLDACKSKHPANNTKLQTPPYLVRPQ